MPPLPSPLNNAPHVATTPTHTVTLWAGQQHLTCLAPGATLQVLQGSADIASGPLILGQVLANTQTVMDTGSLLTAESGTATWVQIQARGPAQVRLLHTEPATPMVMTDRFARAWRQARQWLRAGSDLGRTQAQ